MTAAVRTMSDRIPSTIAGVTPLKGKRNPVRLVSAVINRKILVRSGIGFEAIMPPTTMNPAPMATRLIYTWRQVNVLRLMPRIMMVCPFTVLKCQPVSTDNSRGGLDVGDFADV